VDNMIVFVSYSSRNRERVEELVLQLGHLGHDVQFESKVIGGQVTWSQVVESIKASDLFVSTLSSDTLISYTSRIEYDYARELNKYILLVALEEISTLTSLEPEVRASLIDFSPSNPAAQETLSAALSALATLEPRPIPDFPIPNWNASLNELDQRIKTSSTDPSEQGAILFNLREFLERHDTFGYAKNLLANFSARNDLRPEIRVRTNRITSQVRHVGSFLQKVQQRGVFVIAIIISVIISFVVIILSQVVAQIRAQRSVTLVLSTTAVTSPTIELTVTAVPTRNTLTDTILPTATLISPTQVPALSSPVLSLILTGTPTVIQLATNTPRSESTQPAPTATSTVSSTVTLLPSTATVVPSTPTLVAVAPISLPTQVVSLLPFHSPFTQLLNRNVYVGLGVEDSLFGVRVNLVGSNAKSAGVEVGDYILAVGLNMIRNRFEFARAMRSQTPSSDITLRMRRNSQIVTASWVLNDQDFVLLYPD
jgi:hypothetical protein